MKSSTVWTREKIKALKRRFADSEEKLRAVLLSIFKKRENIHLFGWFVSPDYTKLPTPQFHKDIYDKISDPDSSYVAIGAPRGHAKSTVVDYVYAMWSGCFNKHYFCIVISDTYTQAVEFVNALKEEFESNLALRFLFGKLASSSWKDGEFVLNSRIKYTAKGAGMKIRGVKHRRHRPDLVIVDDLENDENVDSVEQRKKLKRWFIRALLPAITKDGKVIVIGTILHYDSLLNNILDKKEMFASWHTKKYTAIFTDKKGQEQALWAEHMDLDYLKNIRDNPKHPKYIGSIAFAQEYMNKPFDETDAIIQPDWIQFVDEKLTPNRQHILSRVMTIDPAASERAQADPTGRVIVDLGTDSNLYVRAIGNERATPLKTAEKIKEWDNIYKPDRVGIEDGALGIVFKDLLTGLPVLGLKTDGDKVRRLLSVARFFESRRIFIVEGVRNAQELYDQLLEFPKGTHDDLVDALVYAIRMLLLSDNDDYEVYTGGGYEKRETNDSEEDEDEDEDYENY